MEKYDPFDDGLRLLVRSVEHGAPPAIEEKIGTLVKAPLPRSRKRLLHRPLLALSCLSGVAAVILAIWLIIPSFYRHEAPQIAEIRTEFVLADKNITIIFVQKPDFPVLLTSF
jgi:hypothetical protein